MTNFGERLQQLRSDLGIKQKELEEKSGIQQATLSAYETGRIDPSLKVIGKLAEALNCEIADFFPKENENSKPFVSEDPLSLLPKDEKEIILDYRAIPRPDQKRTVKEVVKSFSKRD